jgi:hypothetical protein
MLKQTFDLRHRFIDFNVVDLPPVYKLSMELTMIFLWAEKPIMDIRHNGLLFEFSIIG